MGESEIILICTMLCKPHSVCISIQIERHIFTYIYDSLFNGYKSLISLQIMAWLYTLHVTITVRSHKKTIK